MVSVERAHRPLMILETGLNSLKSSQLMGVPKFHHMYDAIKNHHKEEKLSKLTGKAADLIKQGEKDTKFYLILSRMMCEVASHSGVSQETNLNMVYNWYHVNRSQLKSGPKFGKGEKNKLNFDLRLDGRTKVVSPRTSAKSRQVNKRQKSALLSYAHVQSMKDVTSHDSMDDNISVNWTLSRSPSPGTELRVNTADSDDDEMYEVDHDIVDHYGSSSATRISSWAEDSQSACKPSPERITSARRRQKMKPKSRPTSSGFFIPKKQPITSLVNPHGRSRLGASKTGSDSNSRQVQFHQSMLNGPSQMDTWKEFQYNVINSQEILGKLSFVGRSGTPYDVRYVAHDEGEMPELNTDHVISSLRKSAVKKKSPSKHSKYLLSQSLGEFCEMTDGYYSPQLHTRKPKSASRRPYSGQAGQSQSKNHPLGHVLQDSQQPAKSQLTSHSQPVLKPDVKVTTLMKVIDSVTANMNHFKEKMAPSPKPGFRQPASPTPHLLHARPVSVPAAKINRHRLSPVNRPISAYTGPVTDVSAGFPSSSLLDRSSPRRSPETPKRACSPAEVMSAGQITIKYPELSTPVDTLDQAVDWRGKVSPEVISQKWKQTGLGSHSYVKSLKAKKRTLSASSRPKTAPVKTNVTDHVYRNWNSHCDFLPSRSGVSSQLSRPGSHVSGQSPQPSSGHINRPDSRSYPIDQDDVDEMLVVKYLGGTSQEHAPYWYEYDGALLARLSETQLDERVINYQKPPPYLEFLTLVTPKEKLIGEKNINRATDSGLQQDSGSNEGSDTYYDSDRGLSDLNSIISDPEQASQRDQEKADYDLDRDLLGNVEDEGKNTQLHGNDLELKKVNGEVLQESNRNLFSVSPEAITGHPENSMRLIQTNSSALKDCSAETPNTESILCGANPLALNLEQITNDDRTENQENSGIPETPRGRHLHSQIVSDPWNYSEDIDSHRLPKYDFPKRPMTGRARLADKKELQLEPVPLVDKMFGDDKNQRSAGRSQSAGVPLCRFLRKPGDLAPPPRTAPSIPSSHHKSGQGRTAGYGQTFMSELDHHARRVETSRQYVEKVNCLRSVSGNIPSERSDTSEELTSGILTVCRLPRTGKKMSRNVSTPGSVTSDVNNGDDTISIHNEDFERRLNPSPVSALTPARSQSSSSGTGKSAAKQVAPVPIKEKIKPMSIGRPIPCLAEVQDPEELACQVERQKQAKAVVDIQRIFRGYVARNYYVKLQKEERERREDEQKAAVAIQRAFKQHLNKMKYINNRPKVHPELQTWTKEYETRKKISQVERQIKRDEDVREMAQHQLDHSAKLSVIGPHVEIYQIYHQKNTGPTMAFLHQAATEIQRRAKGYLVRKKLTSLQRKALYQGSNWTRCVQEYKHMLWKVQERHGVIRPKMPFTFNQINEFMDTRRRYESIFEKKAFGGELDVTDLPQFFKECDLCPSQTEIDDALDVVLRGALQPSRGLYKQEVMEILFHIYPPPAAGLINHRTSTWMNPIIDGEEANKLIGSEFVEDAPLSVCVKLVVDSKRERREREKQERDREEQEKEKQERVKVREERKKEKQERVKVREEREKEKQERIKVREEREKEKQERVKVREEQGKENQE